MQRAGDRRVQRALVDRLLRPAESAFWDALDRASSWAARMEAWARAVRRTPWGSLDPADGVGRADTAPADAPLS